MPDDLKPLQADIPVVFLGYAGFGGSDPDLFPDRIDPFQIRQQETAFAAAADDDPVALYSISSASPRISTLYSSRGSSLTATLWKR